MKICKGCDEEIPPGEERPRSSKCLACRRADGRAWYQSEKNAQSKIASAQRWAQKTKEECRQAMFEHFQRTPCVDCGESDPLVLTFDHVRGEKKGNIADMVAHGCSVARLLAEIEKCEVRCANCHMRKSARDLGWDRFLRSRV